MTGHDDRGLPRNHDCVRDAVDGPNSKCVYRNFYSEGNASPRPSLGRDHEFWGDAAPRNSTFASRKHSIFQISERFCEAGVAAKPRGKTKNALWLTVR
jgi:hypothetical protein